MGIFRGGECFFLGGDGGLDKPAAGTLRECWASFEFAGACCILTLRIYVVYRGMG